MAKAADDITAELGREIKALRKDLAALVASVKELGAKEAASAASSAKEAVEHVTETVKMTAEDARRRGEAAATEIESMIAKRPIMSALVALGLGYFVGRFRR